MHIYQKKSAHTSIFKKTNSIQQFSGSAQATNVKKICLGCQKNVECFQFIIPDFKDYLNLIYKQKQILNLN